MSKALSKVQCLHSSWKMVRLLFLATHNRGIVLGSLCRGGKDGDMFSSVAIAYTLGSVTVPSLASVYNEFALKKHMDTSVHEQNFFLYFYGALFNLLGVLATMAFGGLSWSAIFHGHSKVPPSPTRPVNAFCAFTNICDCEGRVPNHKEMGKRI